MYMYNNVYVGRGAARSGLRAYVRIRNKLITKDCTVLPGRPAGRAGLAPGYVDVGTVRVVINYVTDQLPCCGRSAGRVDGHSRSRVREQHI